MDELKQLLAVLLLYRANFHNLHWNAVGSEFDNMHKSVTSDYYDQCLEAADTVAEFIARLGGNPPNYKEVLEIVSHSDKNYLLIDSSKLYDKQAIQTYSDIMLKDICKEIIKAHECEEMNKPINCGIKSSLETLLDEFDLQTRYLNKRRKKEDD